MSGVLARFEGLRIVVTEGQTGWMSYVLERVDRLWHHGYEMPLRQHSSEPPSSFVPDRVYSTMFEDGSALDARARIGMSQIMMGSYYPHRDSTFPKTLQVVEDMVASSGLDDQERYQLVRGNAIRCFRLDRYGIEE
jgi:hypothetical protein